MTLFADNLILKKTNTLVLKHVTSKTITYRLISTMDSFSGTHASS